MFIISGPSLLYVFKKWSEFTLKVVRVYLKIGPSLPGPNLPGPSLLVFVLAVVSFWTSVIFSHCIRQVCYR